MKIAIYLRVSTKAQGEIDTYGLAKQSSEVAAFVAREGHEVVREFRDVGYSGATADRPALAEMLLATGFEAVVVPALDRLARSSMLDGYLRYTLESRGIAVLSATESNGIDPQAKLLQGILAAVAAFERSLITQRLAGGRRAKSLAGGYAHGRPRLGTRAQGGALVDDGSGIVARAREMRAAGSSIREIAQALEIPKSTIARAL